MTLIASALFITALTILDQRAMRRWRQRQSRIERETVLVDREVEVRALVAQALLARAIADEAMVGAGVVPVEDRDAIDLSEWDK